MAAPYTALPDKLDRAICAYMISAGVGGPDNIVPALNSEDRTVGANGLCTVRSDNGREEWLGTGNYRFDVSVELKIPCAIHPDETNPQAQMLLLRQRAGALFDVLLQTEDGHTLDYTRAAITTAGRALAVSDGTADGDISAANNADMVDFTCLWWQEAGLGTPAQAPGLFVVEARFEAIACASNIG